MNYLILTVDLWSSSTQPLLNFTVNSTSNSFVLLHIHNPASHAFHYYMPVASKILFSLRLLFRDKPGQVTWLVILVWERKTLLVFFLSLTCKYSIFFSSVTCGIISFYNYTYKSFSGENDSDFSNANKVSLFWWNIFYFYILTKGVFIPFLQNGTWEKK